MTYSEKLKDPRRQQKRLRILDRDEWACQICKSKEKTLHVHHRYYLPGLEPWEYKDDILVTLCFECHESEEQIKDYQLQFLHSVLSSGFFNCELIPLHVLFREASDSVGKKDFDWIITRLALSEAFRNDVLAALKLEKERQKEPYIDGPDDLEF